LNLAFLVLAADRAEAVVSSLQAALMKTVGHAREWHEQADFKSLNQSATELKLLAALLQSQSDDRAWQEAFSKVDSSAGDLQTAARAEDAATCGTAIASLQKVVEASAPLAPSGKPLPLPQPPGLRPLMLILDGIQADAKKALLTGRVDAAKKQAFVLAELGQLVSNSRQARAGQPDAWQKMAAEFIESAQAVAASPETDAAAVRQLLKNVSQRCEACHETRTR
jgi:hypothetical protein